MGGNLCFKFAGIRGWTGGVPFTSARGFVTPGVGVDGSG